MANLAYFSRPGSLTEPGPQTELLDDLPSGIAELCQAVQGTSAHIFSAKRSGISLSPERKTEFQLRSLERRLGWMTELDPRLRVAGAVSTYIEGGLETIEIAGA